MEGDAFGFEALALLEGGVAAEADGAVGAEDAPPGEAVARVPEELDDVAVVEGVAGGGGYVAVAGDFAFGDGADGFEDGGVALLVGAKEFASEGAEEFGVEGIGGVGGQSALSTSATSVFSTVWGWGQRRLSPGSYSAGGGWTPDWGP
jgi:hypothetical protein